MKISVKNQFKLWRYKWKCLWKTTFSHHPLCAQFKGHYWKIKDFYFCQGCFLTLIGFLIGFFTSIALAIPNITFKWYQLVSIMLIIITPIAIVEGKNITNRPIKRLIRFDGGIGIGFFLANMLQISNISKIFISFFILIVSYYIFIFLRRGRNKKDLCETCKELNQKKICSGYKLKIDAEKKYSAFFNQLLKPQIDEMLRNKYSSYEITLTGNNDDEE